MIPTFITVRASSTRLAKKCFLDFGEGMTVLDHVVKRCQHFGLEPTICAPIDDMEQFHKIDCAMYFGSMDPQQRWFDCAKHFDIKAFHALDADDPFFDPYEVMRSFAYLQDNHLHCVLPSKTSAGGAALMGTSWADRQGETMILPEGRPAPQIRMTLDYPEDYWFLRTLVRLGYDYKTPRVDIERGIDLHSLTSINKFRTDDWKRNKAREMAALEGK